LATSFGEALQMTNIIKDTWDDRRRGVSWLPRDVFRRAGVELETMTPRDRLRGAMNEMVGLAHGHLRNALTYTLAIPREETGIRRFLLWALGLAVLTLRKVHGSGAFLAGGNVKVSRRTVRLTVLATSMSVRNDWMLSRMFDVAAAKLPVLARPRVSDAQSLASGAESPVVL
jgi:farnesyl-diphosphate farnesyltransferase